MELLPRCTEKRFCAFGEELLRVIVSVPSFPEEEAYGELTAFTDAVTERTLAFAETRLLPSLAAVYEGLSPHDRKFSAPRRVYRVEITAEKCESDTGDERFLVTLTMTLKRRGSAEASAVRPMLWGKSGKEKQFRMLRPSEETKKAQKQQKIHRNIHFVHKCVL